MPKKGGVGVAINIQYDTEEAPLMSETVPLSPVALQQDERLAIWSIAYPAAISSLCRLAMGVVDLAFLGHLGTLELAASSAASISMRVTGVLLWGSTGTLCMLCSQAIGAQNPALAGLWLQVAVVVFTLASFFVMLFWGVLTRPLLHLLGYDADVVPNAELFSRISLLWVWPNAMYMCLRWFFQSQGIVRPAMIVNVSFIGVNVLLNYVLIHGAGKQKGMGFAGSPTATVVSIWLQLITYWAYMYHRGHFKGLWRGWQLREALRRDRVVLFLQQASLNALSQALNTWGVDATSLLAGAHLGPVSLAAQSAAYYILFTLNAIQYGICTAVTVRLGRHLGARLPLRAKVTMGIGLALVLVCSGVLSVVLVAAREVVGHIFSSDAAVLAAISDVAPWVALAFTLFGVSSLFGAVLSAQARPGIVSLCTVLCKWALDVPFTFMMILRTHAGLDAICLGFLLAVAVTRTNWTQEINNAIRRSSKIDEKQTLLAPLTETKALLGNTSNALETPDASSGKYTWSALLRPRALSMRGDGSGTTYYDEELDAVLV